MFLPIPSAKEQFWDNKKQEKSKNEDIKNPPRWVTGKCSI
jgi:hypothetical protein